MKIIDLLNKIANGELKNGTLIKMSYSDGSVDNYCRYEDGRFKVYYDKGETLTNGCLDIMRYLIKSEDIIVEIIEEDKKIEKIKSNGDEFYSDYIDTWISKNKTDAYCEFLGNKINELIDEINKLKEK